MGLVSPAWIITGVIALTAGGYIVHCEYVKKDREQFINRLRAQAEEQEKEVQKKEREYKEAKEAADNEAKRKIDDLAHALERLRKQRTSAVKVPAAPASTSRPDLACFDRAELGAAFRVRGEGLERYRAAVLDLAREGAESTIALDAAKGWALKLSREMSGGRTD